MSRSISFQVTWGVFVIVLATQKLHGEENKNRDEEIFSSPKPSLPTTVGEELKVENMRIGGRLEYGLTSSKQESTSYGDSMASSQGLADIYFEANFSDGIRTMLRTRYQDNEQNQGSPNVFLDELWVKGPKSSPVFWTLGKQHLKWGSGRFWNPTDFLASEAKDPFATFDRRLGLNLLKLHVPFEKSGANIYFLGHFSSLEKNKEFTPGFRAEFLWGTSEWAFTYVQSHELGKRAGFDVTSALGPVDIHLENAFYYHYTRPSYQGELSISDLEFPSVYYRKNKVIYQGVYGIDKSFLYAERKNIDLGIEYFYNELGYDHRSLEFYAFLNGAGTPLYLGRRYLAGYLRLPEPLDYNATSINLSAIYNLSDDSGVLRLADVYKPYLNTEFELAVSSCLGDLGDMCLGLPPEYREQMDSLPLPTATKLRLEAMPAKKIDYALSAKVVVNF